MSPGSTPDLGGELKSVRDLLQGDGWKAWPSESASFPVWFNDVLPLHILPKPFRWPASTAGIDLWAIKANLKIPSLMSGEGAPPPQVQLVRFYITSIVETLEKWGLLTENTKEMWGLKQQSTAKYAGFSAVFHGAEFETARGWTDQDVDAVTINPSLSAEQLFLTSAHEVYHQLQYQYSRCRSLGSTPSTGPSSIDPLYYDIFPSIREGGARLAEYWLSRQPDRGLPEARAWFANQNQSLFEPTKHPPSNRISARYASSLFWLYMAEQHSNALIGSDTQKEILLSLLNSGQNVCPKPAIDILRNARAKMAGPGHLDSFLYLDPAGREVVSSETTWGNFQVAIALNGTAGEDKRFTFRDTHVWRDLSGQRLRFEPSQSILIDALPVSKGRTGAQEFEPNEFLIQPDLLASSRLRRYSVLTLFQKSADDVPPSVALQPFAMRAWRVNVPTDGVNRLLRVRFWPIRGLSDALVQIVLVDHEGRLRQIYRHDGAASKLMDQVVSCNNIKEAIVLVSSRTEAGDFSLALSRVEDRSLISAASWNTLKGRGLPVDPHESHWTWRSPDFYLNTMNKRLYLELVNLGLRRATGVQIEIFWTYSRDIESRGLAEWRTFDVAMQPTPTQNLRVTAEIPHFDECREQLERFGRSAGNENGFSSLSRCSASPSWSRATFVAEYSDSAVVKHIDPFDLTFCARIYADSDANEGGLTLLTSSLQIAPRAPAGFRLS